jgi:hypothetical protein
MRIQGEMVKMLNERSWEDFRLNYPDAYEFLIEDIFKPLEIS